MSSKVLSNTSEYCVTRIALRYTPPTFLVEYKISSHDAIISANIYHIEIVIGGLTPASNPSVLAKILVENCGILRQSSSTSTGVKFHQIVRLCQKLVERQMRNDSCCVAGAQNERKGEMVENLSSKVVRVIKGGIYKEEEQITHEHTPPISCIFLPQQKSMYNHGCENGTTCEVETFQGQELLLPSSSASRIITGVSVRQNGKDTNESKVSTSETDKMSVSKNSSSHRRTGSYEESVSKAVHPVESTNQSLLQDSSQNCQTGYIGHCSEKNSNFCKPQVLSSIDVSIDRRTGVDNDNNDNFETKIPICQTTCTNVSRKQSSNRTGVQSYDYSNYSEAFEEESTATIRTYNDFYRNDDIQGNMTDMNELVVTTQNLALKNHQHTTLDSCRRHEIENQSEQQLSAYSIETELETNFGE